MHGEKDLDLWQSYVPLYTFPVRFPSFFFPLVFQSERLIFSLLCFFSLLLVTSISLKNHFKITISSKITQVNITCLSHDVRF